MKLHSNRYFYEKSKIDNYWQKYTCTFFVQAYSSDFLHCQWEGGESPDLADFLAFKKYVLVEDFQYHYQYHNMHKYMLICLYTFDAKTYL